MLLTVPCMTVFMVMSGEWNASSTLCGESQAGLFCCSP
jgi:hypothetical protein